ncbi:MAG: ABC transporter permease [Actinomycetota bacterium]
MLLLVPALGWWLLLLAAPFGLIVVYSVLRRGTFGGVVVEFTFDNYRLLADGLYAGVVLRSLLIAGAATVLAVCLGYPAAYYIARRPPRLRILLLFLIILPFWTSLLIRTYGWIVLLNREGVVNEVLIGLGLIDRPLEVLYTPIAVVLGLTYAFLPLMVLPLYASLERMPDELREASSDLGAKPIRTFRRVVFPLSKAGLTAGAIFVFIPSLGNFVVPDLLGGGRTVMVGNLIQSQFLQARDWPFGSALAMVLILVGLGFIIVQNLAEGRGASDPIGIADG